MKAGSGGCLGAAGRWFAPRNITVLLDKDVHNPRFEGILMNALSR
jgi:hypothetical protein